MDASVSAAVRGVRAPRAAVHVHLARGGAPACRRQWLPAAAGAAAA